jgi:hypothetical protein
MVRKAMACALCLGVTCPGLGNAGESQARPQWSLPVGGQVRVRSSANPRQIEGVVLALDAANLTLASREAATLKIPVGSLQQVKLRTGSRRNALKGLLIGAAIGVALGATSSDGCVSTGLPDGGGGSRGGCAALVGALCGGIGLGIGALTKSDVWTPIPLPVADVPASAARRLGVTMAVSF